MKAKQHRVRMPLFDPASPGWAALSSHDQHHLIDVLSQLLRDVIEKDQESNPSMATNNQEDVHVS